MSKEENKSAESKKKKTSIRNILFGDILENDLISKNYKFIVFLAFLAIVYVDNRLAIERQQIKIRELKKELTDIRYRVLTTNSEIMSKSRQSNIENYINSEGSEIKTAKTPPFIIK